jgi:putative oxidoreductase
MLNRLLTRRTEGAFAFLRVLSGAMFAFHGLQKLFGVLTASQTAVGSQVWIGGVIEQIGRAHV